MSSPYRIDFDIATIKHLGLQMYATLPPVIGELVANAWDANATEVRIAIPETPIDERSEIVIEDNGIGMSDSDLRKKYLIVGRDRRESERTDTTPAPLSRPIMGRKGIGKFSAFGIARELEIESASNGAVSRFAMDYDKMLADAERRHAEFPPLAPTGHVAKGTRITLRRIPQVPHSAHLVAAAAQRARQTLRGHRLAAPIRNPHQRLADNRRGAGHAAAAREGRRRQRLSLAVRGRGDRAPRRVGRCPVGSARWTARPRRPMA